MSVFTLTIDEHAGQFGVTAYAEQQVIRELFAQAALAMASGAVATEAAPKSLVLNRTDGAGSGVAIVVGSFAFGADSHAVAEQQAAEQWAREAAQAEADAAKASAVKPKGKAA